MQLYDPIIMCLALLELTVLKICRACGSAEYKISGECCPMCSAGERVYKHCFEDLSTTCVPCMQSTYTHVPNGMVKCLPCTVCAEDSGLQIKEQCIPTADTLCAPLPGYYCVETHAKTCEKARQHSTCRPGQYINQNGTALTDTVCKDCPEGTHSDGSFNFCKPHRKCESLGQITAILGTKFSDTECAHRRVYYLSFVAVCLHVLVILLIILWTCISKRK